MNDRLKELNKLAGNNPALNSDGPKEEGDEEKGGGGGGDDNEFMGNFFNEVSDIKTQLKKFSNNVASLEKQYQTQLQTIAGNDKKAAADAVDQLIDSTGVLATQLQQKLKKMDEATKAEEADLGPAEARIRKNTHTTLVNKFLESMQKYQDVQTKYRNQFKEQAKAQIKVANPNATDAEVEEVIESGRVDKIFADQALERHQAAKNALTYVKEKHKEILKIEQSLQELYQLFVDMASLVAEQSELINQIDHNINQTKAYTAEAVSELKNANKMQKKSKKTLSILIGVVIIVIIIGVVLAVVFGLGVGRVTPAPPTAAPA